MRTIPWYSIARSVTTTTTNEIPHIINLPQQLNAKIPSMISATLSLLPLCFLQDLRCSCIAGDVLLCIPAESALECGCCLANAHRTSLGFVAPQPMPWNVTSSAKGSNVVPSLLRSLWRKMLGNLSLLGINLSARRRVIVYS